MHDEIFAKNGLSLERLRAFIEIVSAGGPTRAAKSDPTRQSQYSRQLKELEEFFGTELFARRGGRWTLTEAGRSLHRLTNEHLNALAELCARSVHEPVTLRFGAGESFLQWQLLPRLRRLHRELSETRFVLLNRRSEDIAAGLLACELEFGVLPTSKVPVSLKSAPLPPTEFQLFVPIVLRKITDESRPHWPLGLPFALLEGGGAVRDVLMEEAAQHGLKLNIIIECSSHLQAAEVARQGLAIAVLPAEARTIFAADNVDLYSLSCLRKATRRNALAWNARVIRTRPALTKALRALKKVME
jgi:DNA-binding transcriptional LysR family regulator